MCNEKNMREKTAIDLPWAAGTSVAGLLLVGVAYSLGDAYYNAYLREFSIHHGAFPVDHPTHLVLAVWGALNAAVSLEKWVGVNWLTLCKFAIFMLAYFGIVFFALKGLIFLLSTGEHARTGASKFLDKQPLLKRYLATIIFVILIILSVLWFCIFLPSVIAIPSAIGEAAGKSVAEQDKKDFDKGCGRSEAKCYRVVKGGIEVARGFVVAQSSDRIALYYEGGTSQLSLNDAIMQTLDKQQLLQ